MLFLETLVFLAGSAALFAVLFKTDGNLLTLDGSAFRCQLPGVLLTAAGILLAGAAVAMWVLSVTVDSMWVFTTLSVFYLISGLFICWHRLREIFEKRHARDRYRRQARQRALSAVFNDRA